MKSIGNNDSSAASLPAAPPADGDFQSLAEHRRAHGRRIEIAEDSDLVDLLRTYAASSLAQVNSLIATSGAVVQDVAYFRGLKGNQPDSTYEFASFTETVARHCGPELGPDEEDARSCTTEPDTSPAAEAGHCTFTGQLSAAESLAWATAMAQVEAETGTKFNPVRGRKKNRAAGRHLRRVRTVAQELLDNPEPLPDFPCFDPEFTFYTWLRSNIEMTDTGVYSSLLGATASNSLRHMTSAMTFAHGLPKFLQRCLDGDFTIEHVDCVTRTCRDLHFEHFPAIDDFLAERRADITIETFKRSLSLKIAATQPPEDTLKSVAMRRRVDYSSGDDGTAYLTLTGPAPELQACYRRLEAFARAVLKSNTSAFSSQLKSGDCFDEERSISALMFDILSRTRPQLKLRIISTNSADGESSSTDFPLDGLFAGPDGVPMREGEALLDYIERVFDDMDEHGYANRTQAEAAEAQDDSADCRTVSDASAPITPADRTFESKLLDAILGSRTTTCDDRHEAAEDTSDATGNSGHATGNFDDVANGPAGGRRTDALAALIGSRASGARPAGEGTGEAAIGSSDAFGSPIRSEGTCRISFEFLLDMPTGEYWLSNQARTFITVPMLSLLSQFDEESHDVGNAERSTETAGPPPIGPPLPSGAPPTPEPPPSSQALESEPPPSSQAPETEPPPGPQTQSTSSDPHTGPPLTSEEVCNLAGMLPDGSPIPAEMARRVAGYSTTWTRLLTDPATGTPIDAKAMTYSIPNSIRKTLVAQFVTCTFPGCTRAAETAEIDHIDPFDHTDPSKGGLTRFGNLHCLCKLHHQQKTDRKYEVRMTEPGHLEYVFRQGTTLEVVVPDNPINVEHARLFLERFGSGMHQATRQPALGEQPVPDETSAWASKKSSAPGENSPETGERPPATDETSSPVLDDALSPAPGERRRAPACPEPAAADGQPGWRETDPNLPTAFQPAARLDPAKNRSVDRSADDDSAVLRDWFWDSGEPPPF